MTKEKLTLFELLYLYLSECDGTCCFCNKTLKKLCEKRKNKI